MNEEETIEKILSMKTIAVVGLSDNSGRPSYGVASYLSEADYKIVPVNPSISSWKNLKVYPDLSSIPFKVDVVDIFRKPNAVLPIVQEAIKIGAKAVWMQEGVVNDEAAELAEKSGMLVVMDRCMMKEREKRK